MKAQPAARGYNQVARAEASAERDQRILKVFTALMRERWLDEFTLNDVADGAGVTVQTVIRKFGGKEGLLGASVVHLSEEIEARRAAPIGDLERIMTALVADYDEAGDFIMRFLNQEDRQPVLAQFLTQGRAYHRAWVSETFKPWLKGLGAKARRERTDCLVAATDLYLWRLFRRDMGHDAPTTATLMRALVAGILGTTPASEGKHDD